MKTIIRAVIWGAGLMMVMHGLHIEAFSPAYWWCLGGLVIMSEIDATRTGA